MRISPSSILSRSREIPLATPPYFNSDERRLTSVQTSNEYSNSATIGNASQILKNRFQEKLSLLNKNPQAEKDRKVEHFSAKSSFSSNNNKSLQQCRSNLDEKKPPSSNGRSNNSSVGSGETRYVWRPVTTRKDLSGSSSNSSIKKNSDKSARWLQCGSLNSSVKRSNDLLESRNRRGATKEDAKPLKRNVNFNFRSSTPSISKKSEYEKPHLKQYTLLYNCGCSQCARYISSVAERRRRGEEVSGVERTCFQIVPTVERTGKGQQEQQGKNKYTQTSVSVDSR